MQKPHYERPARPTSHQSERPSIICLFVIFCISASLIAAGPSPAETRPAPSAGKTAPALPATGPADVQQDAAILPFIDDDTLIVMRFDVARIDVKALHDWVLARLSAGHRPPKELSQTKKSLDSEAEEATKDLHTFLDAGGKQAYVLVTLARFEDPEVDGETRVPDFFYVIPLAAGADEKALMRIFDQPKPKDDPADNGPGKESLRELNAQMRFSAQRIGKSIAVARPGVMKVLQAGLPHARPDLRQALAAAGNATVIWAAAPSDSFRKLANKPITEKNRPDLETMREIVNGVNWAAASVRLPPDSSIHVMVQTKNAEAAVSAKQAWEQRLSPEPDPAPVGRPDLAQEARMAKVTELLKPVKAGLGLTLDLNKQQIDELAQLILPDFFE